MDGLATVLVRLMVNVQYDPRRAHTLSLPSRVGTEMKITATAKNKGLRKSITEMQAKCDAGEGERARNIKARGTEVSQSTRGRGRGAAKMQSFHMQLHMDMGRENRKKPELICRSSRIRLLL